MQTSYQICTIRDNAKDQLRAYIGLVAPADNQVANAFFPPAKPLVRLTPKNFGLTPAYEAAHATGMAIVKYPLPKGFDYPVQKAETPPNRITIYPGVLDLAGILADADRALTTDEIASIQDGKHFRLGLWGTIKYKDAFNDTHYTNFCLSFYNLTASAVQREPCNDHNDSN